MPRILQSRASLSVCLIFCLNLSRCVHAGLWDNPNSTVEICSNLTRDGNATGAANVSHRYGATWNDLGIWRLSVESRYEADNIETALNEPNATSPNAAVSIWLDPWSTIDLNWGGNDFSACAYMFRKLPRNTMLRGQNDDTSCKQMLSKECITAIETKIAEQAQWQVANPTLGPFSNLTPPILEPICSTVIKLLGHGSDDTFPKECRPYFDDGSSQWPLAESLILTGNVSLPTDCGLESSRFTENAVISGTYPQSFPPGWKFSYNGTSPANAYDNLTQEVFPILTLIMPPANHSRQSSIGNAYAQMSCIRAQNITAASRVAPALPKPTRVRSRATLSKGTIAGIVVGLVLGVAVVVGAGCWCWRRQRKPKAGLLGKPHETINHESMDKSLPQIDGTNVYQLSNNEKPAQLHGNHSVEMGADVPQKIELEGSRLEPQEMIGSVPARGKK